MNIGPDMTPFDTSKYYILPQNIIYIYLYSLNIIFY